MQLSSLEFMSRMFFLAEPDPVIDDGLHFWSLPPNYAAWFFIPLALIAFAWLCHRGLAALTPRRRWTLTALRAASLFFVAFLLFDPYRQFLRVEEIRSLVRVLVDDSASMARTDAHSQDEETALALAKSAGLGGPGTVAETSRQDLVRRVLEKNELLDKIAENHDLELFAYSTARPRQIESLDELEADGPVTATGDALAALLSDPELQARPGASVILIGDGRTNAGVDALEVARAVGANDQVPIHTIGVGDASALQDLELRFVRADEVVLEGNTIRMALVIRNHGLGRTFTRITITDQNRRAWIAPAREQLLETDADQIIELDVPANHRPGEYMLDITLHGPAGEENTANNTRKHALTIKDDRLRVLYVETLPRWEYRRLKNFLVRGSSSFVAHCLLLSAEPNFLQEHTRLPGMKPLRQFPTSYKDLDEYDVLIFGDVDPTALVPTPSGLNRVLKNIQRFVDNGGGLAVIAGEGWTPHAFADTPLEETLPIDVGRGGDAAAWADFTTGWKPKLTAFGRAHPITQLARDTDENLKLWESRNAGLAKLRWWYPVRKATPAAQVLAYHPTQRNQFGPRPLLVTGSYGEGPVFFSATDETWRWFHGVGAVYFNRFWGNVIRHLARAHLYRGSKRFKLMSSASEYGQGETAFLTAFVKDANFDDATARTQRVMITPPEGRGRVVEFEKKNPGEYIHAFKPAALGAYEAWVVGPDGIAGRHYSPITFQVKFVNPEKQDPTMNEAALKNIADAAHGTYHPLAESIAVLQRLQADSTRHKLAEPEPLRNRPWLPALLVVLLTTEWLLRKRWRLA